MPTANGKEVLTTGQVARICHVAPRTVSKWFDSGKLRGYRVPGSRDRRIPVQQLVAFMRAHDMPLDGLDGGACRVLVVGCGLDETARDALAASERYAVIAAENGFEAGMLAEQIRPHVVVLDARDDADEAGDICRNIKHNPSLPSTVVLAAVAAGDEKASGWDRAGFDGRVTAPLTASRLVEAVERATDLIT